MPDPGVVVAQAAVTQTLAPQQRSCRKNQRGAARSSRESSKSCFPLTTNCLSSNPGCDPDQITRNQPAANSYLPLIKIPSPSHYHEIYHLYTSGISSSSILISILIKGSERGKIENE